MTYRQQAYQLIDAMSEDNVRLLIEVMSRIQPNVSVKVQDSDLREKQDAFTFLEKMRKEGRKRFTADFDYHKAFEEAMEEKYGSLA